MINGHTMSRPRFHYDSCMRAETIGHCFAAFSLEAAVGLAEFQDNFCNKSLFF